MEQRFSERDSVTRSNASKSSRGAIRAFQPDQNRIDTPYVLRDLQVASSRCINGQNRAVRIAHPSLRIPFHLSHPLSRECVRGPT